MPYAAPFDALELSNGTYCFVDPGFWGSAPIHVSPKYVPVSEYNVAFMGYFWTYNNVSFSRLGSKEAVIEYLNSHKDVISEQGRVDAQHIKDIIPARMSMNDFISYSSKLDKIGAVREATLRLSKILIDGGLGQHELGITGSVLLRGEIDGFSDFDLVIYGADAIRRAHSILKAYKESPDSLLRYRSREEAEKFYNKYSVISELTPAEFADAFIEKFSQGIMQDVPFSIFQVPAEEDLPVLNGDSGMQRADGEKETFAAEIVDDTYSRYTYKCLYRIKKAGGDGALLNLYCYDRACTEQAANGDKVMVSAYHIGANDYVIFPREGYIKKAP